MRLEQPIRVDGLLDEPAWEGVVPVTDFRQYEPLNGEPATERTEIRIAYDDEFLYFGIRAFDSDPDAIVARQFERDSFIDADDSISIAIDTLNDNRTALAFQTNVLGTQLDVQMSETLSFNLSWDTIWYSKGNIDELGYTIEIAIPWFSLRFKPADELTMGVFLERIIRRKNEKVNWPYLSRDYNFSTVSEYADMVGIRGAERGANLEVKPYGLAGHGQLLGETSRELDAGLDVKWGVTTDVTADLTFNSDFAQVESDDLRINLSRFGLFFPEKRDFFLERADLFRFGLAREVEIFFSRRIGLRGGQAVPILAGARAYGQPGNTNFGLMTLWTKDVTGIPGEHFSVARLQQNILGRSAIGGIYTRRSGDPTLEDTTTGGDAQFLFGTNILLRGSFAHSARPGVESGNRFASVAASQRRDLYDWSVQYVDVGDNFAPGMGFVRRPDQRRVTTNVHFKPRPGGDTVRQLTFGLRYDRVESQRGLLESESLRPGFLILFQSEDQGTLLYRDAFERVPHGFAIAPGVMIPPGEYDNNQVTVDFVTNPARSWSVRATFVGGDFFGGTIKSTMLSLGLRPIPRINLRSENQYDVVDVPGGSFESLITRFAASYYFSPELTTRAVAQYSTLYDELVLNFRTRWIYTPGSEAWLVYDEGRILGGPLSTLHDRALILKLVHNIRF